MARRSFEDLSDEVTLHESAFSSFVRWVGRLLAIALVTLGIAYYVPLRRAHLGLVREHEALVADHARLGRELGVARAELAAASANRDALAEKVRAAGERESHRAAVLADARARVESKLVLLVHEGASVVVQGDALVVALADELPKGAETSEPASLAAKLGLCSVAKALVETLPGARVSPLLAAPAASAEPARWELTAVRAAKVASALESTCRVRVDRAIVSDGGPEAAGKLSLRAAVAD
ncbi:MAG TPA: hypothetical protein VHE30_10385 [Polyangiaceae bacterium]|nr:hypothetical protein [Polyangiaceae bacterium]